jgi:predicted nuclease of predicted toxin-antitoxin system
MLSDDVILQIAAALEQRGVKGASLCPVCNTGHWAIVNDGFITLQFVDFPMASPIASERGFPAVVLACPNCGNTVLINLFKIGLEGLVEQLKEENQAESNG